MSQEGPAIKNPTLEAVALLCSGLLSNDVRLIGFFYPLLCFPALLVLSIPESFSPAVVLLDQVVSFLFLGAISRRWLTRLGAARLAFPLRTYSSLAILGVTFWLLLLSPVYFAVAASGVLSLFFSLMMIPGVVLYLNYFYYFLPMMSGRFTVGESLLIARESCALHRLLPLQLLLAPLATSFLVAGLLEALSPDGRSLAVDYAVSLVTPIFTVLFSYAALSAALLALPEIIWSRIGLDPYRASRFSTLSLGAYPGIQSLFKPRIAVTALIMASLIWAANSTRAASALPSPEIQVTKISISGKTVELTLSVNDPEYHYRGFRPVYFALASEKRTTIAGAPDQASIIGEDGDVRVFFPTKDTPAVLSVSFTVDRSGGKALTELEDLYLWYRYAKVQRLDMSLAAVSQRDESSNEDVTATQL